MINAVAKVEEKEIFTLNFPTIELSLGFLNKRQFKEFSNMYDYWFNQINTGKHYFLLYCDEEKTVRLSFSSKHLIFTLCYHNNGYCEIVDQVGVQNQKELDQKLGNLKWLKIWGLKDSNHIDILDSNCFDNGNVSRDKNAIARFTFNPE